MAQTVAVVRKTLTATGGGTTDFTKTGFGTPTAAIIIWCAANSGANPTAGLQMGVGFWDGTNQRAVGIAALDNATTMGTSRTSDNSYGAIGCNGDDTASLAFTVSSITDGIRLTMSVDNTGSQRFCTVILLAGVSASAGNLTMNATQNATRASGSLGFAPNLVFFASIGSISVDQAAVAIAALSFGFARDDGTHRMVAFSSMDNVGDEQANILYSETRCVAQIGADVLAWAGEVTTFGADTFTITTRDGGSGSDIAFYLALGGADLSFDVGTYTSLTSTGNNTVATDIAPDAVLTVLSTATGTSLETGSGANGVAIGMADDNGQFSHNISVEDAAATSNANSAAQAAALIDLDGSSGGLRTDMVSGTVTLNSADFTVNETTVDATARKGWWVAFGAAAGGQTGDLDSAIGNFTADIDGTVAHVGVLGSAIPAFVSALAGHVAHLGHLASNIADFVSDIDGQASKTGGFSSTISGFTAAFSGIVGHNGQLARTIADFTSSVAGTGGTPATGSDWLIRYRRRRGRG